MEDINLVVDGKVVDVIPRPADSDVNYDTLTSYFIQECEQHDLICEPATVEESSLHFKDKSLAVSAHLLWNYLLTNAAKKSSQ